MMVDGAKGTEALAFLVGGTARLVLRLLPPAASRVPSRVGAAGLEAVRVAGREAGRLPDGAACFGRLGIGMDCRRWRSCCCLGFGFELSSAGGGLRCLEAWLDGLGAWVGESPEGGEAARPAA